MNSKDYELVAEAINKMNQAANKDEAIVIGEVVYGLANVFQLDNQRFDRNTFTHACGF